MSDIGLGSWPARRARIAPHRVALRDEDRSLTYAELADRVDRLAGGLARLGVRAGDRVAYLGPNALATFEALFATCRLGAVFVPLNTRLATPELARLLADCRPTVLVHTPDMAPPDFAGTALTVEEFTALTGQPGTPTEVDLGGQFGVGQRPVGVAQGDPVWRDAGPAPRPAAQSDVTHVPAPAGERRCA